MLVTNSNPSQGFTEFERLVRMYESLLRRHCVGLVYRYASVLTLEDIDDLVAVTNARLWNGYFRDDAKGCYVYQSRPQDIALLYKVANNVATDLFRTRKREQRLLNTLELDAPLYQDGDELRTLADVISANADTAAEVEISMLVSDVLTQACNNSSSPGKQIVARHLLGELTRQTVYALGYSDNYINQETHRFRKAIWVASNK